MSSMGDCSVPTQIPLEHFAAAHQPLPQAGRGACVGARDGKDLVAVRTPSYQPRASIMVCA